MKKMILFLTVWCALSVNAQKKNKDILNSTNIHEIESFLKTAHPEDPRRTVLKPKLIALKNSTWMKAGQNNNNVLKPSFVEIPKSILKNKENSEVEEFKKLFSETSIEHQEKTVKLLNQLFENDLTNKQAILLMKNNSDCNMIVRIQGKSFYNLAIPAKGENFMVIEKGDYQISSNVCDSKYNSLKNIEKNMMVIVDKPILTTKMTFKKMAISN